MTDSTAKSVHTVPTAGQGTRLDGWLASVLHTTSRSRIQSWIRSGHVTVDGQIVKPGHLLVAGTRLEVRPPPVKPTDLEPEPIPLDILYEDEALLVVNKPPGLVVHPAAGHAHGTLVNALLYHCPELPGIGGEQRPGIVHRLDKDTSGLLVVAKTEQALDGLARQFKERRVKKQYTAFVRGQPTPAEGYIDAAIARDPHNRQRMRALVAGGRSARSRYTLRETWAEASLVDIWIETGRTHQIRVHMAHIGHPVLGDTTYGRYRTLRDGTAVPRQMLHAAQLAFDHPVSGVRLTWQAPLPEDMNRIAGHLWGE